MPATVDRLTFRNIGIVGAGAMGRGIVQIAAQAGCTVHLLDAQPTAVEAACAALHDTWNKLVAKGRMSADEAAACQIGRASCRERV